MMPQYWCDFVESNRIVRKSFHFTESDDQSGIGADLTILTAEDSLDEATRYWPGIGVAPDGYVPVAHVMLALGIGSTLTPTMESMDRFIASTMTL